MKLRHFIAATATLLLSLPASADIAPKRAALEGDPAQSLLWVGNSFFYFNNGIHRFINGFSSASGQRIRSVLVGIGGSGIDWHDVDGYLKPGSKMGWYSFVGDNEIVFNKSGRQFDTVIIMDCSQCPVHPQLKEVFREYARQHADSARRHGVRPVLFMSWAYKDVPEMTAQLSDAYTQAANDSDALVIPAGIAFAKARAERPQLELYQPDKRHPSLAGTYLAAATSFAALTGKSPVGSTYLGGLDADSAKFLQSVAWQTVQEFYAKKSG